MGRLEELQADVEELQHFIKNSVRPKIKEFLQSKLDSLQKEIEIVHIASIKPRSNTNCYTIKLTNYDWSQTDKYLKIYVSLKGVQEISSDFVQCSFKPRSMDLQVTGLEGKNYQLIIDCLLHPICTDKSFAKVSKDKIIITMEKEVAEEWSHVTSTEKKTRDAKHKTPKYKEGDDPGASLMQLMRQMYDEGDDELKRTISKAYYESREKQMRGESPMDL